MTTGRGSDVLDEGALTIFTDGSMFHGPQRGGIGVQFVWVNEAGHEETHEEVLPPTSGATNNQMELEAVSFALEFAESGRAPFELSRFAKVIVRTDSQYVAGNVDRATYQWSQNKWTTAGDAAVLNVNDWKRLLTIRRRYYRDHHLHVRIEWIQGKKGAHAKRADKLAKASANSPLRPRTRPNIVRRRTTAAPLVAGSVRVIGQTFVIRIVKAQHLPRRPRSSRYAYEVTDASSSDLGRADWAESELDLRPSHTYRVRMSADPRNPRIEELLEEVAEDLSRERNALAALARAATARHVLDVISRGAQAPVSLGSVRRRLAALVEAGEVQRRLEGRTYVYELVETPVIEARSPSASAHWS